MRPPRSAGGGGLSLRLGLVAIALVIGSDLSAPSPLVAAETDELRVCADPNNLPFSNADGAGFENKLAELVAGDLGKHVTYSWWAQRRGFVRNTLNAKLCDVVMGVPVDYELVEATRPYYRSTYVFVSRADRNLRVTSIKDPGLRELRIGVHLIGSDGTNTPPSQALGQQNIVKNVVGYMIYGDYREPNPPARLIEAVENGRHRHRGGLGSAGRLCGNKISSAAYHRSNHRRGGVRASALPVRYRHGRPQRRSRAQGPPR